MGVLEGRERRECVRESKRREERICVREEEREREGEWKKG